MEENNQNKPDISELLKSIQNEENTLGQEKDIEGRPFLEDFDMDSFSTEEESQLEKTLTSLKAQEDPRDEVSSYGDNSYTSDVFETEPADDNFNLNFQTDLKEQSIKNLEEKIQELESRFEDVNKEKSFNAAFSDALDPEKDDTKYTPAVKANDEFFRNISNTIETLKGSLENIVSARLEYEETIIKQDQTLITRLREKTSRLKAINLALNSEVKRAKNEKLESLRKSAEQTKELLSLRVQLSKVEEKARHGDFKLSNLEQQLSVVNSQKLSLDEEILKIREDKLSSLRKTAEQTKEIMTLRLELSKTEEKFKQEELQAAYLKDQLLSIEQQRAALDNELYSTRSQREEANRKAASYEREIESLKSDIERSQGHLKQEAEAAGALREKILSLETELQRLSSEKAGLLLKSDEQLRQLENMRADHEREISNLKAAQVQEIELLKQQKSQEAQSITLELKRAEDKYRQEETFVSTLKLQIESLQNDVKGLDQQRAELKGKSTDLAREIEFIKEGHETEIQGLKQELANAQEKFEREEIAYNSLAKQLSEVELDKANLNEEIKRILSEKDDALRQNEQYLTQIEDLKLQHQGVLETLKADLAKMQEKHEQDTASYNDLKNQYEGEVASLKTDAHNLKESHEWEKAQLASRQEALTSEKNALISEKESLIAEKDALASEKASLISQKDELIAQKDALIAEKEELLSHKNIIASEKDSLLSQRDALTSERASLASQRDALASEKENLESQKNALVTERDALLAEKASLISQKDAVSMERDSLKAENTAMSAEIDSLRETSLRETQKFLSEIENLKQATRQESSATVNLIKQSALSASLALSRAESSLRENENIIAMLKGEVSSLDREKVFIDSELKKANTERVQILTSLEEKTKELDAFRQKYEQEILSVREEKAREASQYQEKLSQAQERLTTQEKTVDSLKDQIRALENEKNALDTDVRSAKDESSSVARKIAQQTEEIISLKGQLAKAESRFLQDTVLISQLKEQFHTTSGSKNVLDNEIKKLREENIAAQQDLADRDEEIRELKNVLSKTKEQLQAEESAVKQLQEHTSKLKAVNFALDKEVKKVQAEKLSALRRSAEQAKEILMLREELSKAENGFKTLDFENGIISIRKEYEAKVEKLETELKDASARFAEQVQEINNLKTDNSRLKNAEEEKLKIEAEYKLLSEKSASLEAQLKEYQTKDTQSSTLARAKAAALTAQIVKLKRDKSGLEAKLAEMQKQIDALSANEKETSAALTSLKEKISGNDVLIEKLKQEITVLTSENKELASTNESLVAVNKELQATKE